MFFESCRCSKDEAWRWLVKGGQTRSELFSRTKDRKIYSSLSTVLIPISPFYLYESIWQSVCSSWSLNIFFFFTRKSGNLSQMYRECTRRGSVFGKGSRAIFHSERSAAIPARGSLSETGVWNMARRVISAYLSAQRRGRNCFSEWKSSAPTRRERIPRHFFVSSRRCRRNRRSGQSRPRGKFYRNSIEKLLTNNAYDFFFFAT